MCHSWVYVYITIVTYISCTQSYTSNLAFVVDFMYEFDKAYTIPTYAILVATSVYIYMSQYICRCL